MLIVPSMMLLLAAQSNTPAVKQPDPVLQVGIFSYGPDAAPQAAAYATSLDTESLQYAAGCEVGAGNRPVPDRATDAWRVSGAVERITKDEAVVRIDWQRVRAGGAAVSAPGGSVELTLHSGDRVPLDSATPEPAAACGGRTLAFEARFGPRPGWLIGPRGALTTSPAVTIMTNGGGGGVSSARSGGAGTGTLTGAGGASFRGRGSDRDLSANPVTADLWLARTDKTQPDRPDFNLQGVVLQAVRGTADFAFSPFTIATPAGPINVQIGGTLKITSDNVLVFTATRTIKYASPTANGEATSTATGRSTTTNPMPGPDEVLSFELPQIRVPNTSVTVPDVYSVRLRIR